MKTIWECSLSESHPLNWGAKVIELWREVDATHSCPNLRLGARLTVRDKMCPGLFVCESPAVFKTIAIKIVTTPEIAAH